MVRNKDNNNSNTSKMLVVMDCGGSKQSFCLIIMILCNFSENQPEMITIDFILVINSKIKSITGWEELEALEQMI